MPHRSRFSLILPKPVTMNAPSFPLFINPIKTGHDERSIVPAFHQSYHTGHNECPIVPVFHQSYHTGHNEK